MKFEHFKGRTLNLEVPQSSHPFYLPFISHNCTPAKLSRFYTEIKVIIHLKFYAV